MLMVNTNEKKEIEYDAVTIYETFYIVALVLKSFFSVFVFALGLKSAITIGHPKFYKPSKWLQNIWLKI